MNPDSIIRLICMIPALVAGLTVHEFAHAWAADRLGDDTPRREGRLTLDPVVHIDPFGALFFIISSLAGFGLGWAKPVMTNPRNLKHPRRDSLLIAVAGPISNILQTPLWLLTLFIFGFISQKTGSHFDLFGSTDMLSLFGRALVYGVVLNIGLAAFNMIPIPPLDGHWVLQSIGGRPIELLFDQIRPFAFIVLIIFINTPVLGTILGPVQLFAITTARAALDAGIRLGG
ncbi:site-2 protease family protein [bacterium]|nr:MAG: site-2 protease family protein [bacterium]